MGNDKKKKAVALKYTKESVAPTVIAKGEGYIAEKIIEKGKEENINIYEDKNVIDDLIKLNIGQEIPPELYEVVAEIIAFVYYLDKKKGDVDE